MSDCGHSSARPHQPAAVLRPVRIGGGHDEDPSLEPPLEPLDHAVCRLIEGAAVRPPVPSAHPPGGRGGHMGLDVLELESAPFLLEELLSNTLNCSSNSWVPLSVIRYVRRAGRGDPDHRERCPFMRTST